MYSTVLNTRGIITISLIIVVMIANCAFADFDTDPFYDRRGKLGAPAYDSISEHIDPFSGNMLIVHTDLHLPGKGGLDLNITRSYNSLMYGRTDNLNPTFVAGYERSTVGPGWALHMGILRNPPCMSCTNYPGYMTWGNNPIFELPDGTKQIFYPSATTNTKMVSKDFWTLTTYAAGFNNAGTWDITSPDGTKYRASDLDANTGYNLANQSATPVAQVISITNASQTATITVAYNKTKSATGIDKITDSLGRVVTFNYDPTSKMLSSITTDTRTIKYTQIYTAGFYFLTKVEPPEGNPWQYAYATTNELSEVTFPAGGKYKYTYVDTLFSVGGCSVKFRVVSTKETQKIVGTTDGLWQYSYNSGSASGDITTVIAPNGVTEKYTYYGWGNTGSGFLWKVGLPKSQEYSGGYSKTYVMDWDNTQISPISNSQVSNVSWGCPGSMIYDSVIYFPALISETITRDNRNYQTQYSNFNSYGDPQTGVETGDATRTKSLTYCTYPTLNIVKGKVATETITGSTFAGTSSSSWTYGSGDCINPTQTTINGVATTYTYYPGDGTGSNGGNLWTVTDANAHKTTYGWSNGNISSEANPIYSISRVINIDGTVKSETNGRFYTTNYSYDGNLRPTVITPPVGNQTTMSYSADNSTKIVTRGSYAATHTFDGFSRPAGTSDTKGVTTTSAYKAYGVKDFTDSNIGDKTTFDFFGRPTAITDKDNYSESYNYAAVNGITTTTVTDKNNQKTILSYTAFGNPDEKYLMSAKDQDTNITSYPRNILGKLTKTTQGSLVRNFNYDPAKLAFLTSESNPENGTITYVRDNVGNMKQRSDASGTATYTFDEINRLKNITKNSEVINFDYDSANNRTLLSSSAASITYTFDEANRQKTKTETIAGKSYTTTYGYTANDIINIITYPSGRIVNYGINNNNQVSSITGFVNNVSYNSSGIHAGLPSSYTFNNNNLVTTPTYNNRQLITDISAGPAGSALTAHYGYDTRGNTNVFTSNVGSRQDLGYDNLSRLLTFSGTWGTGSFTYDAVGNRKTKGVGAASTTYNYNVGNSNNHLDSTTNSEAASYSYNGNGALSGGTWNGSSYTLTYNAYDNLISYKNTSTNTVMAIFGYDGDGMRVTKTTNGKTVVYHYDQSGNAITETESNGTLLTDYILLNGKLVAKVVNIPVIAAAPAPYSFSTVYVNKSSGNQPFTIKNNGTGSLVVGTISLAGTNATEYAIVTDGCSGQTLSYLASCTLQVSFNPTTTGTKSATISIPSNDPVTPTASVSLSGTGILPTLIITPSGTGTGTVTSTPGGISCGSICSGSFMTDSSVTLDTSPDMYALFTGWSGACSGTGICTVIMNGEKNVTAAFTIEASQISGTFYLSPQEAYNNSLTGDTIYAWDTTFNDGLICNQPRDVTILGGYDKIYSTVTGTTKLTSPLIIQQGSVRVNNLAIVGSTAAPVAPMMMSTMTTTAATATTLSVSSTSGPAVIRNKKNCSKHGKKFKCKDETERDDD